VGVPAARSLLFFIVRVSLRVIVRVILRVIVRVILRAPVARRLMQENS
jgi:hypothetical protein